MTDPIERSVSAELVAVLVAVTQGQPRVLTTEDASALPAGPFELAHRSLQAGLRDWVETQTHHPLGYVEQLYTFADRDRSDDGAGRRTISVSYLGLTREAGATGVAQVGWQDWYRYFPWEDHRDGVPALVGEFIAPRLRAWARAGADRTAQAQRRQRAALTFGLEGAAWNEDMVLQRYELLFEAGLVPEAARGQAAAAPPLPGQAMRHDHRRILATGIARLRAKIKYRPVVFELMPPEFTLLQLQLTVEALAGRGLHKQNFRRLIEQQALVEETGDMASGTTGRPAKLFRFRRDVLLERAIAGSKLPLARQPK
ncbi:NUDIX hydrolase [Bordetella petrii]|uniref:NUDIX hydrolase n=1 Tax=Bordetella petrii TaxID=94624 RepID=UPI003731F019